MTKEQKAKWIEALRSGKYAQTRETLARNGTDGVSCPPTEGTEFCCLGVAALVLDLPEKAISSISNYPLSPSFLSLEVQKELSERNDLGSSFSEIADLVKGLACEDDDNA